VDFEEFNLFQLSKSRFEILWLCLSSEYLLKDIPKKIKDESLTQEENITKKLYKDYAAFRNDIFESIQNENPEYDKLTLFKKTQKLLDRFLFIFFAEDRLLLPPNSIPSIVNQWTDLRDKYDEYVPLYDRFKKYFGYMNTGHKGQQHDIFAYNGGLFAPDEILDNIKINDDLLQKHTVKLSNYDFESEVSVNILGHIFEHSLNDIDEIQAEIKGIESEQTKTKRKKDGVFYTPKYITKYIVDNTVGKLCEEKKAELDIQEAEYDKERKGRKKETLKKLSQKIEDYRNWLLKITICDPACGSGAFLNQALEFLIAEHQYIDELQAKLFGDAMVLSEVENSILENNLYGVDINEESVEIAKLSLWLRTAQKGRKLTTLNNNIKCGNSLIDDPKVAGDKAFIWQKEFPEVFKVKDKKAFHITTATHDSRTSQRMIDYKVRELRDGGTRPKAESIWLTPEDGVLISEKVAEIIKEDNLNVMAYNICGDHMHLLLVCEDEEISKIVGKIKAKTALAYNTAHGITTLGQTPTPEQFTASGKKRYNSLWTQKFGCKEITDDNQLWNTVEYIRTNRDKHELPPLSSNIDIYKETFNSSDKGSSSIIDDGTTRSIEKRNSPSSSDEENSSRNSDKGTSDRKDEGTSRRKDKGTCPLVLEDNELFYSSYEHAFRTEYKGGFDVVIGNPPYGAKLDNITQKFLNDYYIKGGSETAISFIKLSHSNLLKVSGEFGFIIPKSFSFASNYKNIREYVLTDLHKIIDCKKVWKEVKLEQIMIFFKKNKVSSNYISGALSQNQIIEKGIIPKKTFEEFGFFLNDVSDTDLAVARKMIKEKKYIKDIAKNSRGGIFQKYLSEEGNLRVLGGTEIQREGVVGIKGRIDKSKIENDSKCFINENSVLVQNIVAHIENPIDHIKITACYPIDRNYAIVDTVNQITFNHNFDAKVFWLLFNSKLINWYCYFFVLAKAIRTIHFDSPITNRIPIVLNLNQETQKPFIISADYMLSLNKELQKIKSSFLGLLQSKFTLEKTTNKLQNWHELDFGDFLKELKKQKVKLSLSEEAEWMQYFNEQKEKAQKIIAEINKTDKEIDQMVYKLYELTEDEIAIVEEATI
jgi:REP element-mobilizing transposase RayT